MTSLTARSLPWVFQSTRSSQTSTQAAPAPLIVLQISIHEVFADLDATAVHSSFSRSISIHEVFADLDWTFSMLKSRSPNFNPRGLRRPRQYEYIHRKVSNMDFNPRGLRRPRQSHIHQYKKHHQFQSTRSSQTSTVLYS